MLACCVGDFPVPDSMSGSRDWGVSHMRASHESYKCFRALAHRVDAMLLAC